VGLIDWPGVARGTLWVLGLSIALAAWSYAAWWASRQGMPRRRVVGLPLFTIPFFAGLALFSAGLAWGLDRLWMRVLWIFVGVWSLWEVVRGWRMTGSRKHPIQEELDETH
jgi:apolipoprotein N-acyltransferase